MADAAKSDSATSAGGVDLDVDVEKDTLTNLDQPPGLAAVYAGKASAAAADDISDKLIGATNGRPFDVLIVTGGSILADTELATALRFEIASFQDRLSSVQVDTESAAPDSHVARLETPRTGHRELIAPMVAVPFIKAAFKALPGGVGLVSKLIAHQYTTSSATLDHVALGMDLRVAGSIRAKLGNSQTGHVTVERFWQPPSSTLLDSLTKLAHAHRVLAARVAQAVALSETAKEVLDDANKAKEAGNSQLVELSKDAAVDKTPDVQSPWSTAWGHAKGLADTDVTGLAREYGVSAAALAQLQELQTDLETFVASALTAPSAGGSILARAMRAEWLASEASRVLLYVAPLAAGIDQVMETKLGPDRRVVLAGSSVEYAAIGSDGVLMFAGVSDGLWGGTMKLDALSDFESENIDYIPVPNALRVEPGESPRV